MTETENSGRPITGLRVLIVEDEGAIALLMEDMLMELGCEIAGSAARIETALQMVADRPIDLAILDLNIAGKSAYPIADALAERDIGFIFSTGYGGMGIREDYRGRPVLQKPFTQRDLKASLLEFCAPKP